MNFGSQLRQPWSAKNRSLKLLCLVGEGDEEGNMFYKRSSPLKGWTKHFLTANDVIIVLNVISNQNKRSTLIDVLTRFGRGVVFACDICEFLDDDDQAWVRHEVQLLVPASGLMRKRRRHRKSDTPT